MKKLITFIVEQRLFSMLFVAIVLLVGLVSIPKLKISSLPVIEVPTLVLNLVLPGASALEIEQRVIYEVEEEFQDIKNLEDFDTHIGNGFASIMIKYRYGVDINDEYLDVSSKINKIRPDLPDDLQVTLKKQNPTDLLISFVLAIVSETAGEKERNQIADALKNKLMDEIDTLDQVEILKPDEEVHVILDLGKINKYGITINQIVSAIQSENRFLPTGTMTFGDKTLSILPPGNSYDSVSDVEETILPTSAGNSIMLRDVSLIKRQLKPDPIMYRVNGSPATLITIKFIDKANVLLVKKQIEESLRTFQEVLPKGISVKFLFNVEESVRYNLSTLITNLVQGMVILMVVLLFAIGYRSGFIVSLMLPTALLMATVCLSLTDFGLQQISIAGFIISLGLMVDNGIVVTENAYKLNFYENYSEKDAAIEGTSRVIYPLLSSTLTTVLAFAPIFLLTSEIGLFLRSLCITIWFCLGASLITAVSFSTILLSAIGTRNYIKHLPSPPSFLNGLIPFRDKCYTKAL
ncbi:MAG: efflux RND transporter permease subunit, partial [Deltaproteobacteria bacterium]|nr:efflux RND transporter permease subunit [Deltaproteobacteria bacterium]